MEAFGRFPTLHPLGVHFPAVLIPLDPLFFMVSRRESGRALDWFGLALLAAGWAGAAVMAAAACVAVAGHLGAVLTHVYRVEVTR